MAAMVVLGLVAGVLIGASVAWGRAQQAINGAWRAGWDACNLARMEIGPPPTLPPTTDDKLAGMLEQVLKATFPGPRDDAPIDQPDDVPDYEMLAEVADWTDALPGLAEARPDALGGPPGGFVVPGPAMPPVEPVDLGGGKVVE